MTNLVTTGGAQVPAHIAKRMGTSNLVANIGGGIDFGGLPRISIKGSTFRIIEGGGETPLETRKLNVIIVGANPGVSKVFYAGKFTGKKDDDGGAPDCFSLDGVRPDMDAKSKQNDLCATCPNNQWGSKVTDEGQKGKLCADQKRLAVVAANAPDGTIYLLQVTPAALRNLNDYVKALGRHGYPPETVVTELGFDSSASFPKLTFTMKGFIDEDALDAVDRIFDSEEVRKITGEKSQVAALAVPATPKTILVSEKPEQPKATNAKAAAFGVEEEVARPAPKPRKEPAPVATVVSSSLTDDIRSLLGDDDDDGE